MIHNKKSTNLTVLADKAKIAQVLSNLISNSIKYGRKGGTTRISCHESNNRVFINIKDNGIGIADKNIKSKEIIRTKKKRRFL